MKRRKKNGELRKRSNLPPEKNEIEVEEERGNTKESSAKGTERRAGGKRTVENGTGKGEKWEGRQRDKGRR